MIPGGSASDNAREHSRFLVNPQFEGDRGREGFRLPSLRTIQADLPYTALQSVVTPSGLTVENINCGYVNNSYLLERLCRNRSFKTVLQ
ncbi:MAG: hypothetical protein B6D35_10095 [Candidatus Brocadia sp. UTAMX2]|nr:MAG: hypothetical protein B6D35_10095 [Candidatus Brocadia sp. UTAMX2]